MNKHLTSLSFALAIVTGAFLVFQVQPIVSKRILPQTDHSPTWTAPRRCSQREESTGIEPKVQFLRSCPWSGPECGNYMPCRQIVPYKMF